VRRAGDEDGSASPLGARIRLAYHLAAENDLASRNDRIVGSPAMSPAHADRQHHQNVAVVVVVVVSVVEAVAP